MEAVELVVVIAIWLAALGWLVRQLFRSRSRSCGSCSSLAVAPRPAPRDKKRLHLTVL
jgi:flagellar biogenesis protein FliO